MRLVEDFCGCDRRHCRTPVVDLQVFRAVREIIPGGPRHSDDLSQRIAPRFSRFGLNAIQNSAAAIQNEVMKAADNPGAGAERQGFPPVLGFTRVTHSLPDILRRRNFQLSNDFPSCRILNFDNVSFTDREL